MNNAEQPLLPADLRGPLLLRDRLGAEGAFLLVHLVKAALGSGPPPAPPAPAHPAAAAAARVVLLAAAQAGSHYAAVLRKGGLHCPALVEAGRLAIVEPLPGQGGLPSLRDLHQRLAAGSERGGGGGLQDSGSGVVLVADDLTALRCLADSEADWAAFLQACTALGQIVVDVEPLESGRSADTTGRLLVTRRDAGAAAAGGGSGAQLAAAAAAAGGDSGWHVPGSRQFCYKLQETGARYVAV